MFKKYTLKLLFISILLSVSFVKADLRLNWRINKVDLELTYKDKNNILISTQNGFKILKLKNKIYLLSTFNSFKTAYNLDDFIDKLNQNEILKRLPQNEENFRPVLVIKGNRQTVLGYEGDVLLLKDFDKSMTIVSSQDKKHIAIRDALLPMLSQLVKKLPNLPNKQFIEVLKVSEFGLPLRINNQIILTKSEYVTVDDGFYSLEGYAFPNKMFNISSVF